MPLRVAPARFLLVLSLGIAASVRRYALALTGCALQLRVRLA
jgi:hypothetical protein